MCHYSPEGQKETHSCTEAEGISELVQLVDYSVFDTLETALFGKGGHGFFFPSLYIYQLHSASVNQECGLIDLTKRSHSLKNVKLPSGCLSVS